MRGEMRGGGGPDQKPFTPRLKLPSEGKIRAETSDGKDARRKIREQFYGKI